MPDGSVRISPGYFTKHEELEATVQAIKNLALSRVGWDIFEKSTIG